MSGPALRPQCHLGGSSRRHKSPDPSTLVCPLVCFCACGFCGRTGFFQNPAGPLFAHGTPRGKWGCDFQERLPSNQLERFSAGCNSSHAGSRVDQHVSKGRGAKTRLIPHPSKRGSSFCACPTKRSTALHDTKRYRDPDRFPLCSTGSVSKDAKTVHLRTRCGRRAHTHLTQHS